MKVEIRDWEWSMTTHDDTWYLQLPPHFSHAFPIYSWLLERQTSWNRWIGWICWLGWWAWFGWTTWILQITDDFKKGYFKINYLPMCRYIGLPYLLSENLQHIDCCSTKRTVSIIRFYSFCTEKHPPPLKTRKCSVTAVNCRIIYRGYPTKWVGVFDSLAM